MENSNKAIDFAESMISEGHITLRPLVNRCAAGCGRQISDNRILCMRCLTRKREEYGAKLDQQAAASAMVKAHDEAVASE